MKHPQFYSNCGLEIKCDYAQCLQFLRCVLSFGLFACLTARSEEYYEVEYYFVLFFYLFYCSWARGLGSDGLCGSGRSNPGAQGGFGHLQPAARKPTRLLVADSWAKEINRIDTDQEDSSARKKTIALCLIHYQVVHKTGMILFPLLERIAVLLEVNIMEILSLIRVPVFPSSSPLVDQTNWGREDSTTSEMRI